MKTCQQKIEILCILALCAGPLTATASSTPSLQQTPEIRTAPGNAQPTTYNLKVSSPIFRSETKKIDLDVKIPNAFRPIQTARQAAKLKLLQFIPKNETPQSWTQMIVLQIVGNQGISAVQFTQLIAQKVKDKSPDAEILVNESKTSDDYLKSALGIVYNTGKRREISYMEYFSSEKHLSGIQYVQIIKDTDDPKIMLENMVIEVHKLASVSQKDPKAKPALQVHWDNMIQMDYPFSDNGLLVHSNASPTHLVGMTDSSADTLLYPVLK